MERKMEFIGPVEKCKDCGRPTYNPSSLCDRCSIGLEYLKPGTKLKKYRVVIPYYFEFFVEAKNKKEAIEQAHNQEGNMFSYEENNRKILVEER